MFQRVQECRTRERREGCAFIKKPQKVREDLTHLTNSLTKQTDKLSVSEWCKGHRPGHERNLITVLKVTSLGGYVARFVDKFS